MSPVDEANRPILRMSWSKLKSFEECQHRVFQRGRPEISRLRVDGRNFIHGTIADRAMRRWLEQPEGTHEPGQMVQYVLDAFAEHTDPETAEYKIKWRDNEKADKAKVIELATRAVNTIEPYLFKQVLPHDYHPEMRFTAAIRIPDLLGSPRTISLVGGIDIAVREANYEIPPEQRAVKLLDLKVTENDNYVEKATMAQLIFYEICWHAMIGTPYDLITKAFLVPVAPTQYRPLVTTVEDRRYMMSRIISAAHGIWRGDKEPAVADGPCWNCDVRHVCTKWNKPVHIDGKSMKVPFGR